MTEHANKHVMYRRGTPCRFPLRLCSSLFICGLLLLVNPPPLVAQNTDMQPSTGRDCATCHLEWADGFDKPDAIQLMDKPPSPVPAASDTCLGCHDGSVADSRRQVWIDHSHKTGTAPSAGMKVSEQLPLEKGALACRTCHTAHAPGGGKGLRDVVFLRMKNDSGQLCQSCHGDHPAGADSGSHPLAEMKTPLPSTLAKAGSHAGADQKHVVCQTCHTAHGSKQEHLLVMGTDSSELCITCHDQMRPGMFRAGGPQEHPQNPPLQTLDQRQAIKDMGTRIGADGRMICLSCHKMHKAKSGTAILADTLADSHLCIRCHADRADIAGTAHDLRRSAPTSANERGQRPEQSGPCGACHSFHSYARTPTPQSYDPQGLCTTCHAEGKIAAKHSGRPLGHPSDVDSARLPKDVKLALFDSKDPKKKSIACLSCHNPHETKQKHFLCSSGDELCANCHEKKVREMAGPHDFTRNDYRNARGRTVAETGKCGFCHAVHDANGPSMWVATAGHPKSPDALCAECHTKGAIAGEHPVARFNHPTGEGAVPKTVSANLPLFNSAGHRTSDGSVACATCHDPHAGKKISKSMLRTADAASLCIQCHPDQGQMAGSLHDARAGSKNWAADSSRGDLCLSCHKPHSSDEGKQRWAVAPAAGMDKDDAVCVGCHTVTARAVGDGPFKPGALVHPQTVLAGSEAATLPHGYPLKTGKDGRKDTIMCQTCHDPHSRPGPQHLLRVRTGQAAFEVCLGCHQEPKYVLKSMHSPELLNPDKPASHACLPCHATHALEGSSRKLLWATKTLPRGKTDSEKLCLGCHSTSGGAPVPTNFKHPETALKKITGATTRPTELQAKLAAIDQITCSTCHIPHGRELPIKEQGSRATRSRLAAAKPMLRPDVDRQICATCHGIDATRVYLYFHDPKKREQVKGMIGG